MFVIKRIHGPQKFIQMHLYMHEQYLLIIFHLSCCRDVRKALDVISDAEDEIGEELDKQNKELKETKDSAQKAGDEITEASDILKKQS